MRPICAEISKLAEVAPQKAMAQEFPHSLGRWIDLMTQASIVPVNKRPRLAIRLHSSN